VREVFVGARERRGGYSLAQGKGVGSTHRRGEEGSAEKVPDRR